MVCGVIEAGYQHTLPPVGWRKESKGNTKPLYVSAWSTVFDDVVSAIYCVKGLAEGRGKPRVAFAWHARDLVVDPNMLGSLLFGFGPLSISSLKPLCIDRVIGHSVRHYVMVKHNVCMI